MNINKGLHLDNPYLDKENGAWVRARNLVPTSNYLSSKPEPGFELIHNHYSEQGISNVQVLGVIPSNNDLVIFSKYFDEKVYNDGSINNFVDEIGIIRNHVYIRIVKGNFGFNIGNPISGRTYNSINGNLYVIWQDGITSTSNSIRILNLDDLGFPIGTASDSKSYKELINSNDLRLFDLFPSRKTINIVTDVINTGGTVDTGSYQFFVKYKYDEFTSDNYALPTRPVMICKHSTVNSSTAGIAFSRLNTSDLYYIRSSSPNTTGSPTTKRIILQLSNIDTSFEYITIGATVRKNGIYSAIEIVTIPVTSDKIEYEFTGSYIEDSSLEEMLIDGAIFDKADALDICNNNLLVGATTSEELAFQEIANNIKVAPNTKQSYLNINTSNDYREPSFVPNEVYALYIHYIIKGRMSRGYHIPGRKAYHSTEYEPFISNTEESKLAPDGKKFQTEYTGVYMPSNLSNQMGFWENEDERYADNFPNFAGEKVRHHKMPDWSFLCPTPSYTSIGEYHEPTISGYYKRVINNRLVLDISNIIIPAELKSKIEGVVITYAKRTVDNSTVVGHDGILFRAKSADDNNFRYFEPYLDVTKVNISQANYIRYSYTAGKFRDPAEVLSIPSNFSAIVNNAKKASGAGTVPIHHIMAIQPPTYQPGYLGANANFPAYISVIAKGSTTNNTPKILTTQDVGSTKSVFPGRVYQMCRYTKNCYISYKTQQLVIAEVKTDLSQVRVSIEGIGGDAYLTSSFQNVGDLYAVTHPTPTRRMSTWISISPMALQFIAQSITEVDDEDKYNMSHIVDFSSINNIKTLQIDDIDRPYLSRLEKRIWKSLKQQKESREINFRRFLATDYYELPSNSEIIVGLQSVDKILYIQTRNTLYLAQIKDTLRYVNDVDAYIGTAELFDYPPVELTNVKYGTIGCQSKFANIITPLGYCVADISKGMIYLCNGKEIKALTDELVRDYFSENLKPSLELDNPYLNVGVVLVYDEKFDRLLVVKIDKYNNQLPSDDETPFSEIVDLSLTYSFSFKLNKWYCQHDYTPNMIVSNKQGIYSVVNFNNYDNNKTQVFKHNHNNKAIYYNCGVESATPFKSFVDILLKSEDLSTFILAGIGFSVEVYANGVLRDDLSIDEIMAYTDKQCTGLLPVSQGAEWFDMSKGRNKMGLWMVNLFRDAVVDDTQPFMDKNGVPLPLNVSMNKNWFEMSNIISKFAVVRLSTSNTNQYDIHFISIVANITKSVL